MAEAGPPALWRRWGAAAAAVLVVVALAVCAAGHRREPAEEEPEAPSDMSQELPEAEEPADTQPPVISGAEDLTAEVGGTVQYRSGVTVTDDRDETVRLQIDASAVNLSEAGSYPVIYRAVDSSGNETAVTVTLLVVNTVSVEEEEEPEEPEETSRPATTATSVKDSQIEVTQEMLDSVTGSVLAKITTADMSKYDKAKAIYRYVTNHIKYVGSSDKSDWIRGAYLGLTRGKGDCYNYYAASRALLTAAGIDNLSLSRVGGSSRHYWNLVNVGDGWYHFDTCWTPTGYSNNGFLMTETQARAYTQRLQDAGVRKNYYVYDYASCPVVVVGTPEEELPAVVETPEEAAPVETPEEAAPVETPDTGEAAPPAEGEAPAETVPPEGEAVPPEETDGEETPQPEETDGEETAQPPEEGGSPVTEETPPPAEESPADNGEGGEGENAA